MSEDEPIKQMAEKVNKIIHSHPPIPTDDLKSQLFTLAKLHYEADRDNTELDLYGVSPCILISLLHEVIRYRNTYGFLELPVDYQPDEEGDSSGG